MTKLIIRLALAGGMAALALQGTAFAQAKAEAGGAAAPAGDDSGRRTRPRPSTTSKTTPSRAICSGRTASSSSSQKKAQHSSLIEIRKDFIPEMLKSLEDV